MQEIIISEKEAGQRLDKYLGKFMPYAPKSFFYKMLRKKNIVLNGKKAEGMERLAEKDKITLFFSSETILKFQQNFNVDNNEHSNITPAFSIIYEDDHILIINKPVGLLSQKSKPEDISAVEHIIAYLLQSGFIKLEELQTFRPGICNRLDRNTSGIMIGGKTIHGLQEMNALLKKHEVNKYYLTIVSGQMKSGLQATGYLKKDHSHNRVSITDKPSEDADYICTEYKPLIYENNFTLLKVKLITGKSHQIRAHLKSLGYPVIGDGKYGDMRINKEMRKRFSLTHHLLHSYEIQFPTLSGCLSGLSEKVLQAQMPAEFLKIAGNLFSEKYLELQHL